MIDAHTPFRTAGLAAAEAREADRLLEAGLLVPVLLDVVVAADASPDHCLRAGALRLLVPDRLHDRGAAISQEAAAWLWCGGPPPRSVDIAIAPGLRRVVVPHLVLHERRVPSDEVVQVTGLGGSSVSVTTPARTAADLLRTLPEAEGLAAAVRVATAGGSTVDTVAVCLERMTRARGVNRARQALRRWPGPADDAASDQSMRLPVTR